MSLYKGVQNLLTMHKINLNVVPDIWLTIPFIIFTILIPFNACKQNTCETQQLAVSDNGRLYRVIWKSKSDINNAVAISDPPCYNEKGDLVVRLCSSGSWVIPKNSRCNSIEEHPLCPPGFVQKNKRCIYITEPQIWIRNCPYKGALEVTHSDYNQVWLPVKRRLQHGPFEYILPGENYGLDYFKQDSSESFEDIFNTDVNCMIKTTNGFEFVECNSMHPHVCWYNFDHFLYKCPEGCVPGGLGSYYCFCKHYYNRGETLAMDKVCNRIATAKYSYERDIIFKLVGRDTCIVGDIQENSLFTLLDFDKKLHLAVHKNSWGLYNDQNINCIVCKVNAIYYPQTDLKLKFNTNSKKLYLNVYSPEGLLKIDKEEAIYCFTDATGRLKSRVDVEEIWDSYKEPHTGRRLKVFEVAIVRNEPGNYWCEVFQLPQVDLLKSNTVVAYKKFKGHEYAARLKIHNFCRFSVIECHVPSITFIDMISKSLFHDRFFPRILKNVRLFHIYGFDNHTKVLDVLLHLTSETKLPLIAEYNMLQRTLKRLKLRNASVVFFRSSLVCMSEATFSNSTFLYWKSSSIGTIAIPREFCVQENGMPVRRKCRGDFVFGSVWGNVEGSCFQNFTLSSKTEYLRSLLYSNLSVILPKNISDVTENSTDITVLDLYYLAEALGKISSDKNSSEYISQVAQIVNNLMTVNATILKQSQSLLNSTDEILDHFELKLLSANTTEDMILFQKDNIVVQVSKPFLNNISGVALYGEEGKPFSTFNIKCLYANTSLNHLADDDNLEVAVYVPEHLLNIVYENMSLDMQTNLIVTTAIYYTDSFFNNDINDDETVASRIVSVTIPDYGEFLKTPVPVLFKPKHKKKKSKKRECAFWNYGTSSESCSGYWSTLGGDYLGMLDNSSLEVCFYSHLTNFGLLVRSGEYIKQENDTTGEVYSPVIGKRHDKWLTIISDIGCSFSIFGITGIFITSIIFQSWRQKVGTRILIQLCIALLLQIIFLNLATVVEPETASPDFCKFIGIMLHYVTVSEFSWMLVAAVLQFFRFVKVIGPMPNRIILKAMLVGWGVPIIPVILLCLVNVENYTSGIQGICYPKGLGLYSSVLFPISVIVSANLAVFITVIRNVFVLRIESRGNSPTILKRQIYLAVLLFFLLGLPWIFGLSSEIIQHEFVLSYIFLYAFCLTATLQGFVLFIFYVILDKSTRTLWISLFKNLFSNKLC